MQGQKERSRLTFRLTEKILSKPDFRACARPFADLQQSCLAAPWLRLRCLLMRPQDLHMLLDAHCALSLLPCQLQTIQRDTSSQSCVAWSRYSLEDDHSQGGLQAVDYHSVRIMGSGVICGGASGFPLPHHDNIRT